MSKNIDEPDQLRSILDFVRAFHKDLLVWLSRTSFDSDKAGVPSRVFQATKIRAMIMIWIVQMSDLKVIYSFSFV
jgi:hypothetical protein